jgi:hypothetical protein
MSCYDCVFKGIYQDMGASFDVCRLFDSLPEAARAADDCRYSGECKYRLTLEEAKKFVEERNNQ